MRKRLGWAFGLVALLGFAASAQARIVRYHAKHPMPHKFGGTFCYIDVPHVHDFPPAEPRLFRMHDEEYYFVGDPAPYGYDGPKYSFYGPHPIVEADVQFGEPAYCYIEGPHSHWYQPTARANFEFRGGAYWYVGAFDPVYYSARPRYVVINDVYRPMAYARPVVDVTVVPPGFQGTIIAPGVAAHAVVGAPAFSAGVHVALPPPPSVHFGVGVNVGAPVVVARPPVQRVVVEQPVVERTVIVHEREEYGRGHHDNGRHEGWYKHGRQDNDNQH
jgi:hypothetical protein